MTRAFLKYSKTIIFPGKKNNIAAVTGELSRIIPKLFTSVSVFYYSGDIRLLPSEEAVITLYTHIHLKVVCKVFPFITFLYS